MNDLKVELGNTAYGTPEPRILLPASSAHFRQTYARLHQIAAAVELETLAVGGGWVVNIDRDRNLVALELVRANRGEVEAGLGVLHEAVAKIHAYEADE